ncbi:solute carrier family 15 member 2-like [Tropilaelaps mercedesae]|uniref:Solute carrier family 15 member 2-like n=1 Tax=Tropilaelaps mercedesae TaxID=418985 RepID=A0A1V9X3N7_9ACAR|nr:solute carrier family 15 member 2-like [Tropilaelaps mercedesae]
MASRVDPAARLAHTQKNTLPSNMKHPYPKSVFFIVCSELCERFAFLGLKAVLSIYLSTVLLYDENDTIVIFHTFVMACYFTPIFGAIVADSWLGRFKTIFFVSIIYATGSAALTVGAYNFGLETQIPLSLLGLGLIALGTGGIKPCVAAFGADQFVAGQKIYLEQFFSVFYMFINCGALLSIAITPFLREVHCDGQQSCFPLAFGIPCVLMVIAIILFLVGSPFYHIQAPNAIILFLVGSPFYRIQAPSGNPVVELIGCIYRAMLNKFRSKNSREHWLDHADDKYDRKFIEDAKTISVEEQASNDLTLINVTPCSLNVTYSLDETKRTFELAKDTNFLKIGTPYPTEISLVPACDKLDMTIYKPNLSYRPSHQKLITAKTRKLHVVDIPELSKNNVADVTVFVDRRIQLDLEMISESGERYILAQTNSSKNGTLGATYFRLELDVNGKEKYTLEGANVSCNPLKLRAGESYTYIIYEDKFCSAGITQVAPSISLLWQMPQYFILTAGEVLFAIPGLEFSYAQAPESMKTLILSFWAMTVGIGNVFVVILAQIGIRKQSTEFMVFGSAMVVDMMILALIAYFYKPISSVSDRDNAVASETEPLLEHSDQLNGGLIAESLIPQIT